MKKLLIILFALLLVVPVFAKQNVGFGFSLSGEGTGIFFLLPSKGRIKPEIITSGYIREENYNLRFGGRALVDLGQKGITNRYTGIAAGVILSSQYNFVNDSMKSETSYWGQLVLGTKTSLENSFLKVPVKIRSEVGLSANTNFASTHIGLGVEYEF